MEILTLPIDSISVRGSTQARIALNESVVAEYAEFIRHGGDLPPVTVFEDGNDIWLADGFHRFFAHKSAGAMEITCEVRQGTKRDAQLFSYGANATHGLQRTREDKRNAVMSMLKDDEWSKWSQEKIAKTCHVSAGFVSKLVNELSLHREEIAKPAVRTVERNGKTYEQNTAKIGKKEPAEKPAAAPIVERPATPAPPSLKQVKSDANTPEDMKGYSLEDDTPSFEEMLDAERLENGELHTRIESLLKDDLATELEKQIRIRQGIEQRLAQEMSRVNDLDKQLKRMGKTFAELRKLLGVDDNSQILSAVKQFVKQAA